MLQGGHSCCMIRSTMKRLMMKLAPVRKKPMKAPQLNQPQMPVMHPAVRAAVIQNLNSERSFGAEEGRGMGGRSQVGTLVLFLSVFTRVAALGILMENKWTGV